MTQTVRLINEKRIWFCSLPADKNECLDNPCDPNAKCTNYDGGYSCDCNDGYQDIGDNECESEYIVRVYRITGTPTG